MKKIERSIKVSAPVNQIWQFLSRAEHLPEIWPSMIEVTEVRPSTHGGEDYHWVYSMFGVRLEGRSEVVESVTNDHRITRTTGGVESTVTWWLRASKGETEVALVSEYTVPVPLLGRLAEAFIVKANEQEAETILANLKARMEVQPALAH